MKHLGNCAPGEFMGQVMAIHAPLAEWWQAVGVAALWEARMGALEDRAPRKARIAAHAALIGDVTRAAIEKCPELTRRLLCLATFTPEAEFEDRPMAAYLQAAYEIYESQAMRDFFTFCLASERERCSGR